MTDQGTIGAKKDMTVNLYESISTHAKDDWNLDVWLGSTEAEARIQRASDLAMKALTEPAPPSYVGTAKPIKKGRR